MNTKTKVTLFCHKDTDLPFVEQRIRYWFGGAEFPDKLLESQVFVFTEFVSDWVYSAAREIFERDKGEASVFEFDFLADLFVRRSKDWMEKHYDPC